MRLLMSLLALDMDEGQTGVRRWMGREWVEGSSERGDVFIRIADSFCCSAETNTTV